MHWPGSGRVLILPMLLLSAVATAASPGPKLEVGGDIKSFYVATFPYDHLLMRDPASWLDPAAEAEDSGQGIADFRLKSRIRLAGPLKLEVHHALTTRAPAGEGATSASRSLASAGVGMGAPQAMDLSWEAAGGTGLTMSGRIDRLVLTARLPRVDLAVGRQPITFGRARVFTPLDLIGPLNPTIIDQEYKPGVDAIRADIYAGTSGQITLAAAYAGDWGLSGLVLAGYGAATLGVWDLGLFLGAIHEDAVVGLSASGSAGTVGLRAEAAVTLPPESAAEEDPFLRAVAGADFYPGGTGTTIISTEVYIQTLGADDPTQYLAQWQSQRVARGELWLAGRYYAAATVSHQLNPIVTASGSLMANLADPSALLAPALSWSVSDEAAVSVGAYMGLGRRPDDLGVGEILDVGRAVRSEQGLVPTTAYLSMRAYF
jgi:hypothetical protein